MNKLCCIAVCVNYSDYLKRTLHWNLGHFDRHLVVTTREDANTVSTCAEHRITCLRTDVFFNNGANFNKAAAINEGLRLLQPDDWVLLMDADILLPPRFGELIRQEELQEGNLYYTHRGTVPFERIDEQLKQLKLNPGLRFDPKYNVMHRGVDTMPWGYFQLLHASCKQVQGCKFNWMPAHHRSANEYDTEFMHRWPGRKWKLLEQDKYKVLHLGHGGGGANWNGRVTEKING